MIITKNHFQVGRIMSSILWITLPILSLVTLLSTYIWNGLEIEPDPISSSLYAGLHRFIWISAVAWIALNTSFNLAGKYNHDHRCIFHILKESSMSFHRVSVVQLCTKQISSIPENGIQQLYS